MTTKITRRLSFTVSLTVPLAASVYAVRDYIMAAVQYYAGGDEVPALAGRAKSVKVKRLGDLGKREPMGGDAIDLSALIRRLHIVESQIRVAGKIPADMPIKVPVKVSQGFGVRRFDVLHVTAKPGNGVLLHFDRDD